jgi:hypothetical protein
MSPRKVRMLLILAVVFFTSFTHAQFSAEILELQKPDTPTQKLYFANNKMRIEWPDHDGKKGTVLIADFATQTVTFLIVERHTYTEMPMSARSQVRYGFFLASDVENACHDWQEIAHGQKGSCHKLGIGMVNGRKTVEYEGTNLRGEVGQFWLDRALRFPVKWQSEVSSGELRNIQEGAQPASLFDVPPGFGRTDPSH